MVLLAAVNGGPAPVLPAGPAAGENENWTLCGIQIVSDPNGFCPGLINNQTVDLKSSSRQIVSALAQSMTATSEGCMYTSNNA